MGCMHSRRGCFVRRSSKMAEMNSCTVPSKGKKKVPPTKTTYNCEICGQEDLCEDEMRSHVLLEHIEGEVSCPFCDLEGTSAEEMTTHVNAEHLDFSAAAKRENGNGLDVAMETTDCGNYGSLESSVSSRTNHSTASRVSSETGTYKSYSSASTAVAQMEIRIGGVPECRGQGVPTGNDKTGNGCESREQSLKRAKLRLDVPSCAVYNGNISNFSNNSDESTLKDSPCNSPGSIYSCPMCSWITVSLEEITRHVNVEHLDALTPSKSKARDIQKNIADQAQPSTSGLGPGKYECPICGEDSKDGSTLEEHVNSKHVDVLSPASSEVNVLTPMSVDSSSVGSNVCLCPVCGMECEDAESLALHVDGHFSSEHTPESADSMLAQVIEGQEREAMRQREEEEFAKLQAMYGMKGNNNYKKQAEQTLDRAVCNGQMSISDYYSKKLEVQQSSTLGIDDGHSSTKGIIPKLRQYLKTCYLSQYWTCTTVDHLAASYGDKGWGCGYRNLQMLLSCLSQNPTYEQVLFNGRAMIPSIPKIQRLIEAAWQKGFDRQGSEQLGGKVVDTTKWIGATEIVATLSSLRVKCQLVDFHAPTGNNGTHPRLFEWVKAYFQKDTDSKPPLYLQHQGHSRTIVGVEEMRGGALRLLVFDPSCSRKQMQQFTYNITPNLMRSLRRNMYSMKAKQYQIVAVVGILTEREYEESKSLKSERIP